MGRREQEHVDEVMRGLSDASEKTQVDRFHSLSVRVGVAGTLNSVVVVLARVNKGFEGLSRGKNN
jgi:hypothetical protein